MIRKGWLYIYGIIYVSAVDLRISKHEGNERSVNLALDTVLEFNHKDNGADMNFLDNVQKFIGKVKTVIGKKSLKRRNFNKVNNAKLTEFILNLIQVLNKFNDGDLEYFFHITAEEMSKYHYKGCKFHELTANSEFRKSLAAKLGMLKNAPASELRRKLDFISEKIEEEAYDTGEKDLIDFINSLYGESSATLFHKTLSNLDDYRLKTRVNMELKKIISNAIRSVLFDYYTELNSNARLALQAKLDEYYRNEIKDTVKAFDVPPRLDIRNNKNTKKITKPKYIKQYVHSTHDPFMYNNMSPKEIDDDNNIATPRPRTASRELDSFPLLSNELRHDKRKKHAEKFNNQQKLIHNKKTKPHIQEPDFQNAQYKTQHIKTYRTVPNPYIKKETIEKYDLYARERAKMDTVVKVRTSKSIHPITSPILDDYTRAETISLDSDNSRNHEYIKYNKHSYKTPKEPDIDGVSPYDIYQNEESLNHKTTKSQKQDHVAFHAIKKTKKSKLDDSRHKKFARSELRTDNITPTDRQQIVTLYPSNSDIESNHDDDEFRQRVDRLNTDKELRYPKEPKPNLDIEFNLMPVKANNPPETDNVFNDDKLPRHHVKKSHNNFELYEKIKVIQKRGRDAKFSNIEKYTKPTIQPDSIEFIAFEDDDLGGINQKLKPNANHKGNKITHKNTPRKHIKRMNSKRPKTNRLTFMTLYPEFIQKWTTPKHRSALRSDDDDTKKKTKHKHREQKSHNVPDLSLMDMSPHIPMGIQKIINAKSAAHAKTIDVLFQTKGVQFKRANFKYKATTRESNKHDTNKNKGIQIIQENLKRLNHPEMFANRVGLVASGGNAKSIYKGNSEDRVFTEDSLEETQPRNSQRRNMNLFKTGHFIDLNYLTHTQTNKGTNIDKYINDTPKQKETDHDNFDKDETIQHGKEETVNESRAGQKDKNNPDIYEDNDTSFNAKEFTLRTYNSGVGKLRKSRRDFVEVQKPKVENIDVSEIITNQENESPLNQNTHNDREPKYTSTQPTKRDISLNAVQSTQNYNDGLYDATRNKETYVSYTNDGDVTKDWPRNNADDKAINENESDSVRSNEEHLKYSSNRNTLGNEMKSIGIQRSSMSKDITPEQHVQGTRNLEKDSKILQGSVHINNVDKETLKVDNENVVSEKNTKTSEEEVVKIEKSDNNVIQTERNVDEKETVAKNLMITPDTIIRQTTPTLEHFSETEIDHDKERSQGFMFRANNNGSLENIKGDSSNFKSSATYVEPNTVSTVITEKITTPTTNYDVKMETDSASMTTNAVNKHTDLKFNSPVTEMTEHNTVKEKINTFTEETIFIRPVSGRKSILDNITNAISNLDVRQENTNAINNFNGTTNSIK